MVFVAHRMAAVSALCSTGIVLDEDGIACAGSIGDAIERYLHKAVSSGWRKGIPFSSTRDGNGEAGFEAFWMEDDGGAEVATIADGRPCPFVARVRSATHRRSPITGLTVTFTVRFLFAAAVSYHHHRLTGKPCDGLHGVVDFRLHVDRLPLPAGRYSLNAGLCRDNPVVMVDGRWTAEEVPDELAGQPEA